MFPFQQIDLSKLSYAAVLDIVAPTLPGGLIALGWLWRHSDLFYSLHDQRALNFVIAAFVIYVTGILTNYLTTVELAGFSTIFLIMRMKIYDSPWVNAEWRKLAAKFLGPDLSPPLEDIQPPQPAEPEHLSALQKLTRATRELFRRSEATMKFKSNWETWYEILRAYFPADKTPQQWFADFYFATLNSIGWACLIAAYLSPRHGHWLIWIVGILTIVASHFAFTVNIEQQHNPDPSGTKLAAAMLKALKSQDQQKH